MQVKTCYIYFFYNIKSEMKSRPSVLYQTCNMFLAHSKLNSKGLMDLLTPFSNLSKLKVNSQRAQWSSCVELSPTRLHLLFTTLLQKGAEVNNNVIHPPTAET